jgi:ubiquinone biosynthesis protein COQ4
VTLFGKLRGLRDKAVALRVLGIMINDPTQTERVLAMFDGRADASALELQVATAIADPEVKARFQERYLAKAHDTDELLRCPPGSLGREYALHLERLGIGANPFHWIPVEDDASYFKMRCRQTHDLVHVLLGAGIRPADEVFVQAFVFAQTYARIAPFIFSMAYLHTLIKRPARELVEITERLTLGYALGQKARPFLAVRWEERWDEPLLDLRRELGVPLQPAGSPSPEPATDAAS